MNQNILQFFHFLEKKQRWDTFFNLTSLIVVQSAIEIFDPGITSSIIFEIVFIVFGLTTKKIAPKL